MYAGCTATSAVPQNREMRLQQGDLALKLREFSLARDSFKALVDMNNRCPLTSYVIVGFSQGAVIAGDMASDIGNGRGPVDEP